MGHRPTTIPFLTFLLVLAACGRTGSHLAKSDVGGLLEAVNRLRAEGARCGTESHGPASPLTWSDTLEAAALAHAEDMVRENFFDHRSSDGGSLGERVSREGYDYSAVAENIAQGQTSVPEVVAAWAESPGHCRNLMGPDYRHMGAARVGDVWVQVFGRN